MRHSTLPRVIAATIAATLAGVSLLSCAGPRSQTAATLKDAPAPGVGLVLAEGEGERRVRRNAGSLAHGLSPAIT